MAATRRKFLSTAAGTGAVISIGSQIPPFWLEAVANENARRETVLVVVQMSGGNDGLNTIVPFRDEAYRKARPQIGIPTTGVLRIDDEFGFHPSARGFADLLESHRLAIVQGVGYPHPNRSHFESMDIWHTCQHKGGSRASGWLGRFSEADPSNSTDISGVYLGDGKLPLALVGRKTQSLSISSPESFRLTEQDNLQLGQVLKELSAPLPESPDELLGFLQSSTASALAASEKITASMKEYQSGVSYPDSGLARKLRIVAQLIAADIPTRVYYVELDGFDTHSQQPDAHAALLSELSLASKAFLDDMADHGQGNRVLLFCFSEFGRRVAENASEGTDHGAAAPVFLAGKPIQSGLIGKHPSLADLDDGDLKHHTDFRQVYAALLQNWLGWDSVAILGRRFDPVQVF